MDKGVDGLMWGPVKIFRLGVVQLEEQDERVLAWKFSPKKDGCLLQDPGYLSEVGHKVPEVVAPRGRRNATERGWKETSQLLDGGVHKRTGQYFRRFAFFPAARTVRIVDEMLAVPVNKCEKFTPVMKEVFVNLQPKVSRSGWTNVKPKRCGPNMFLRTRVEADLDNMPMRYTNLAECSMLVGLGR